MTTHLWLNLYYAGDGKTPALPDHPDLGPCPHAQTAMRHLGITYAKAVPHSVVDGWAFYHCENVPDNLPPWLTKHSLSDHWADALGLPREEGPTP